MGTTSNVFAMGNDEFLTVAEIAQTLKLNQQTVRNWIDKGTLPAFRIGRRVRIARSDFERFVDGGYTRAAKISGDATGPQTFWEGSEESVGDVQEP